MGECTIFSKSISLNLTIWENGEGSINIKHGQYEYFFFFFNKNLILLFFLKNNLNVASLGKFVGFPVGRLIVINRTSEFWFHRIISVKCLVGTGIWSRLIIIDMRWKMRGRITFVRQVINCQRRVEYWREAWEMGKSWLKFKQIWSVVSEEIVCRFVCGNLWKISS